MVRQTDGELPFATAWFRMFDMIRVCTSWLVVAVLAATSIAVAGGPRKPKVDKQAKQTFETRCAGCHGPDGSGTPLGKRLQVADLRSAAVQGRPAAELIAAVTNGKGNMPPFKGKLSDQQITAVIAYVRTLGASGNSK